MPAKLEPLRRVKCTFENCYNSFNSEEAMKAHKEDEHDYCLKCDQDFEDFDAWAFHKVSQPKHHKLACRICGEEFVTKPGLLLHIEKNHPVKQSLTCIGCQARFTQANLFVEHLESGYCPFISASQFQGHIVHKHIITELLKGGDAYGRFQQKVAKFEAAVDNDEKEGGVSLEADLLESEEVGKVQFQAIKPDTPPATPVFEGSYPLLPTQKRAASSTYSDLGFTFDGLSLSGESEASTVVNSPIRSPATATRPAPSSHCYATGQVSSTHGSTAASSHHQSKVWGSRTGKSASDVLFPSAKATPAPKEFSIQAHDNNMEKEHGLNIMRDRFWDPMSTDFNAERFYDAVMGKYSCPFQCEQTFLAATDLNGHILNDHRITRMKCPMCLKYFSSGSALIMHCQSRGSKCKINKRDNFNIFLDRVTGGFLGVEDVIRPEFLNNPTVLITNEETGRVERFTPPVAHYLKYSVTTPPDWKEPVPVIKMRGGMPNRQLGGQ